MPKYPNGCKVTTKNSESCKANEINLLCNEGISQIYISSELTIHEVVHDSNVFHLYASSSLGYGICPYCGHVSSQVHSRYSRTIYDLSILGERVVILLEVRKFFCHNEDCRRKTFVEQPGDEVFRYRRRTCRCERVVARQITEVADKFHLVKNSKLRNEYYKYDAYVEQEATNGKPLSAIHNEESNEKEHVR